MFGTRYVHDLIERSAENPADRRRFLKSATAAGLGMLGVSVAGSTATAASASARDANSISDSAILNFALNLEYLEGEFYSFAVHGHGLPDNLTHGTGRRGPVHRRSPRSPLRAGRSASSLPRSPTTSSTTSGSFTRR